MRNKAITDFMDSLTEEGLPGNAIIVYKGWNEVFSYVSGNFDISRKLYVYSCSKLITAIAALQLIEAGKMELRDNLSIYIPEFKEMTVIRDGEIEPARTEINIYQLLTMTAGFSYNIDVPSLEKARELTGGKMNTLAVIRNFSKEPLIFHPGEDFEYSMCYDVLAALVEVVSGTKFSTYVKEHIFLPLDMNNSSYQDLSDGIQQQYLLTQDGNIAPHIDNKYIFGEEYDSGGAGIITTLEDYGRFTACLANSCVSENGIVILSDKYYRMMTSNQLTGQQLKSYHKHFYYYDEYGYGFGGRTPIINGIDNSSMDFGWGGAAGSMVMADTKNKLGVFYASHMLNPQEEYYFPKLREAVNKSFYSSEESCTVV